ncbi:MAG: RT0821/Lpp0805 family surface protein [Alphaproteobacteria bacterium]|uniref:RT0821/Lpp0805 family surface protein n=1 Tax=Pacificispira sp. TaxID=2888761 RepID=UPI001B20E23B|nr:glycine zipper 2TM domain-containing protein [Alphaproteobacteria bacterium]MBO6865229.1 glycine zipper 2TM domain-containing protein [Alphaproteobacteria bacterium]MEC9268096.1 RT0821/Lpp0805 family surface protein [Pseudomonadota bacterium]
MTSYSVHQPPRRAAKAVALALVAGLGLSACEGAGNKETIGTVGGAVIGGVLGSKLGKGTGQLVAVGAGAVLGGLVGSSIGRSLDDVDKMKMHDTTQTALEKQPDNSTSSWVNPNTGHSGTVTPQQTYNTESGQPCREFTQTVTIGGKSEEAYGTACRQADGSWKIVS